MKLVYPTLSQFLSKFFLVATRKNNGTPALFDYYDVFQISTFENSARKWKWINRERIKAIIIIMFEIVSDVVRAFPP